MRFHLRGTGADEIADLIRETGERAARTTRRKFVEVSGNDAPRALHHELNGKGARAEHHDRVAQGPQRDADRTEECGDQEGRTAPDALRERAEGDAARNRAERGN